MCSESNRCIMSLLSMSAIIAFLFFLASSHWISLFIYDMVVASAINLPCLYMM